MKILIFLKLQRTGCNHARCLEFHAMRKEIKNCYHLHSEDDEKFGVSNPVYMESLKEY